MKRNFKVITSLVLALVLFLNATGIVLAAPEKPSGSPPSGGSAPGGSSSSASSVSYTGASTITSDTTKEGSSYSSTTGSENALLVSGGTSTLTNPTVTKSGDASGDEADFYGTNAAIMCYNGATLNVIGGTVSTDGSHANAVFAYGTGIINISNTTINTSSNNSGAIMVTGGGTLTANNVTAETQGNSSAPIRSDRGGGTLTVNGGTYTSHGTGSPVIYSTADITVNDATLTSTASEGVVVEGKNSVTLNGVTMEATNTKLNGNSETYKSIFIYQSMSGDADVGTSTFTAKDSKIINNKGEIIFVTNTNTVITLENNKIINNDSEGNFLKATTAKWGTSGSNGGNVTLNLINQTVSGDIIVDDISTLDMKLSNGSTYTGAIDNENQAKSINVTLDSNSVIVLTNDSYIDSLTNADSTNSNIYLNGHKLYVDGKEVSGNEGEYEGTTDEDEEESNDTEAKNNNVVAYVGIAACLTVVIGTVVIVIIKKKKVKKSND